MDSADRGRAETGIKELLATVDGAGDFSVWLGHTDGRAVLTHDAGRLHNAASTMKLPVAVALMREVDAGRLDLAQPVPVYSEFDSANGSDRFEVLLEEDDAPQTWDYHGREVELGWLLAEMICGSSNLATNLVLEQVGIKPSHDVLTELSGGTSAVRRYINDLPADRIGIRNEMSAADLAAVLVAVGNDTAASPASCAKLRDLLAANRWNDQIPAGLPDGVRVEHKNGWITGVRHDGGIVRPGPGDSADPFVLVVCTTSTLPDDEAQRFIADVAAVAWRYRHDLGSVS